MKGKPWTKEQEDIIRANYATMDMDALCKQTGRTIKGIHQKAYSIGITGGRYSVNNAMATRNRGINEVQRRTWTDKEIAYLKENYARTDNETLSEKLNHTRFAIQKMANEFSLRKDYNWPEEKLLLLKNNFSKLTYAEISKLIGYSADWIKVMAKRLCLGVKSRTKKPPKEKVIKSVIAKEKAISPRRRLMSQRLKTIEFSPEGKKLIRIDKKTVLYVKASLSDSEVNKIIKRYSKAS